MLAANLFWLIVMAFASHHPMKCFEVIRTDAPEFSIGGIFVDVGDATFVSTHPRFNVRTESDSIRVYGVGFRPVTVRIAEAEDIPVCNVIRLEPANEAHDH